MGGAVRSLPAGLHESFAQARDLAIDAGVVRGQGHATGISRQRASEGA